MITSNGDTIDREPERGDLYISIRSGYALPIIRRLTRYGNEIASLRNPFFHLNRYGSNYKRRVVDRMIEIGDMRLRVPQPEDIISGSLGGKCRVIEATTRLATAIDENGETHWFPVDEVSLTKIYRDNIAYWHWGGEADEIEVQDG